uniref:Xanthine dehydrogenase n=1 Tax=Oncorhynchus kisutch TaxID=8019 RepID=A0A8C7F7Y5_ONCKI
YDLSSWSAGLVYSAEERMVLDRSQMIGCSKLFLDLCVPVGLTGTKLGCAEGGCGACTVMLSKYQPTSAKCCIFTSNSNLRVCVCSPLGEWVSGPLCSLHHCAVTTVEGIGSVAGKLHPVQERMPKSHGSQCGFCTPGIVMSSMLCSGTTLHPAMAGHRGGDSKVNFGVKLVGVATVSVCKTNLSAACSSLHPADFLPLDPTQEIIFPPELMVDTLTHQHTRGVNTNTYLTPSLSVYLFHYLSVHHSLCLSFSLFLSLSLSLCIVFGASCSLTLLGDVLKAAVGKLPPYQTEVFNAVLEQLRWFAGLQIRNVAVLSFELVGCCSLTLLTVKLGTDSGNKFFPGYRKTILTPEEVLLCVLIPYTKKVRHTHTQTHTNTYIVTSGMSVTFAEGSTIVKHLALSYGGMAATTVMAKNTASRLLGKQWGEELLQDACSSLAEEMTLHPSAPGGMVTYRRTLTLSLFYKFYLTVQQKLGAYIEGVRADYISATEIYHQTSPSSVQIFQAVPDGQKEEDVVGRPMMHLSALKQATGEAVYCDDIPLYENELYLCLITSTKAHATIQSIDTAEAESMPGVVTCVFAKDVPGSNMTGPIVYDETVLADVTCVGHIIGAVVADTQAHAQRAAKAVRITYQELQPVIITIQDAITHQSFFQPVRTIQRGDLDQGFTQADHILEGEMHMGGQEHFYLETNVTVAVPKGEDGEMELFVSTQSATKTQSLVAKALGVPASRVVIRVKRMGGGFGGKESRSTTLSTMVAVAAQKLKRPVRCMLDRDEDMLVTGGRHPFYGRYKVGFMKSGKVVALEVTYYSNAGNSMDLSLSIMERALFHMENSYSIATIRGRGYVCKTHLPSNTAFRGFGGPQGMLIAESWMSDVALSLGLPAEQVRRLNMYIQGERTPYSQILDHITLDRCWDQCLEISSFTQRRAGIETYNRDHRWTKRGLSVVPTKFGISFTAAFLNQAGALAHIYTDGSVLLTHGGTEMGQGLNTKMVQVASRTLGIPSSKIHITETSTNTVPNTSPTAASASSDLNGAAVHNACEILLHRLEPYKTKNPKGCWEDWVTAAYFDRVNLSANGFYKTPDLGYDFETNTGRPFNYFSYGVACSEVEIDCLTGSHKNIHTSIVIDVGNSLNPALDIGQVEGGFMQGVGLYTLEELKYSPEGYLFTRGPGMYKIPAFGDIPTDLTVSLLRDAPNDKAIFSSKAIGEPPLFLAASVFFAIKDAIIAARKESGLSGPFRLDSPATPERIRNACEDRFTKLCPPAEPGTFTPWAVVV